MKKCPFCAEAIQDEALRCKHCGADIAAAYAAAQAAVAEDKRNDKDAKLIARFGFVVFAAVGVRAFMTVGPVWAAVCAAFGVAYLILGPHAWKMGDAVRKQDKPDVIIAANHGDLAGQQMYWEIGPQLLVSGFLFLVLVAVLFFVLPIREVVFGPQQDATITSAASTPESASAAPAVASDAPADAAANAQATDNVHGASDATTQAANSTNGASEVTTPNMPQSGNADASSDALPAQGNVTPVATAPAVQENVAPIATAAPTSIPAPATQQPEQTTPTAIVASFDCTKAASKTERLICSSPQSADADRRLAAAYHAAASKSADPATLKQQQREWLAKERNACDDASCLVKVTEARIQALSAM